MGQTPEACRLPRSLAVAKDSGGYQGPAEGKLVWTVCRSDPGPLFAAWATPADGCRSFPGSQFSEVHGQRTAEGYLAIKEYAREMKKSGATPHAVQFSVRVRSCEEVVPQRTSRERMPESPSSGPTPRKPSLRVKGWVTNRRKAAYNRIHSRTMRGCLVVVMWYGVGAIGVLVATAA